MSQDVMIGWKLRHFSAKDVGFFEGPEKLLEIWFDLGCHMSEFSSKGLRVIPRSALEKILDVAECTILSCCSNGCVDAYLLSESTLLVSSQRFILKTCGNTKLLLAIPPLMSLVVEYFSSSQIMNLYYSHRSFLKPLLQPEPHSDFDLEVSYLNEIFDGGVSMSFGKGENKWHLYGYEKQKLIFQDQTLEVLMSDLDPDFMALFSTAAFSSPIELIKAVGLSELIPGAIVDAKIFEPCGFSLNAIDKDVYYTIHVTPQVECSWVSFETNLEMKHCIPLIGKVLAVFRPKTAAVSFMTNEDIPCFDMKSVMRCHYSQVNYECSSLSAYNVVYIELQLKGSSDFTCLSKAATWTKTLSTRVRSWAKNIFFT